MPPLMDPAPGGKKVAKFDSDQISAHSLPLGSPSLARYVEMKCHSPSRTYRISNLFFLKNKIFKTLDTNAVKLNPNSPFLWEGGRGMGAVAVISERSTIRLTLRVIGDYRLRRSLHRRTLFSRVGDS